MPIYRYRYENENGVLVTGEVGARSLEEATEMVRRELRKRQEFVVWDRDDPVPGSAPGRVGSRRGS